MNSSVFIDGSSRIHDVITLTANDVVKVRITRVPIERLQRELIITGSNEIDPIRTHTHDWNAAGRTDHVVGPSIVQTTMLRVPLKLLQAVGLVLRITAQITNQKTTCTLGQIPRNVAWRVVDHHGTVA